MNNFKKLEMHFENKFRTDKLKLAIVGEDIKLIRNQFYL